MESKSTEGIVLRSRDYKEADRLVTFYSRDYGKMTGFARLAKKSKKRFGPVLEPASILHITYKEKGGTSLVFLEQTTLVHGLPGIHRDLKKMAVTWYLLELVDLMTVELDPSPEKYQLIRSALIQVDGAGDLSSFLSHFEYQLLKKTGMEPEFKACLRCRQSVGQMKEAFCVYHTGGLVCASCLRAGEPFEKLSPLDLVALSSSNGEGLGLSRKIMSRLVEVHLVRPLKTRPFLERWPDLMPRSV